MFLALYIWSTPLVVILTSETLSVQPKRMWLNTTCPSVYTLNFDHEVSSYFRAPNKTDDDFYQISVSIWNSTVFAPQDVPLKMNSTAYDYWTDTSTQFEQIAARSKYLGAAVSQNNISNMVCGKGWNCSVEIDFTGPGYKCEVLASGIDKPVKKVRGAEAPFNTSILLPHGTYQYYAKLDQGDYVQQFESVDTGGMPKTAPPYPKNAGAFRTEPVLWFGYTSLNKGVNATGLPQTANTSLEGWNQTFIPNIVGCQHYVTNYRVNMSYQNGILYPKVVKRDNVSLVIDTRFVSDIRPENSNLTTVDNTTATPESNYVYPLDWEKYRKVAAYHSLGKQLRYMLNGTITYRGGIANTEAILTRLIENRNWMTTGNVPKVVEGLYEDIVLSLMSDPKFAAVSWAYDPTLTAGQEMSKGYNQSEYACVRERTINAYKYHARDLWLVYSIAILLAIIAVILGISAMRHERTYRDTRFSSIVAVTRGHSLNNVGWDNEGKVKDVKVGFGKVRDIAGETKNGFGLEGDVSQDRPLDTLRSPVIHMREWRQRRQSRYMDSPRQQ